MSVSVRSAAGDLRDLSEIWVRDEGNTPRMITEIWVRDQTNTLRQVWGGLAGGGAAPLAVTTNPSGVAGAMSSPTARRVFTNTTTAEATGGVVPYTYVWGASDGVMSADSPTNSTTTFSATLEAGESFSEGFACTVTDALGNSVQSDPVTATVSNFGRQLNG
jgi:hypothetical protein